MNLLECPHCKKNAIKRLGKIYDSLYFYSRSKICINCGGAIKMNHDFTILEAYIFPAFFFIAPIFFVEKIGLLKIVFKSQIVSLASLMLLFLFYLFIRKLLFNVLKIKLFTEKGKAK